METIVTARTVRLSPSRKSYSLPLKKEENSLRSKRNNEGSSEATSKYEESTCLCRAANFFMRINKLLKVFKNTRLNLRLRNKNTVRRAKKKSKAKKISVSTC